MELEKMLAITYREYKNYMREELKEFYLGDTDYPLLLVLEKYPGISNNDIARKTKLSKSIVSKSTTKLIEKGYVKIMIDENHKQKTKLYLEEKGENLIPFIRKKKGLWEDKILRGSSKEEVSMFFKVLNDIFEKSIEMR